ncbi:MAG TPA: endonuclease/exonuclease/phosphatase family protein, partial [Verrucomicrobiales bacterium]|nr:endonuclease/exonuclease/phosphatase family protein [Verrucomicrobiales bacterium]
MSSSPDSGGPGTSPLRRFIERRVRFLIFALPLCCALLLIPWDGWLFELLRHFRLWCAVIGLALTLFALLLRQWKWAGIALLTGLWQGYPVYAYSSMNRVDAGANHARFSVLTCNLLYEAVDPETMIASLKKADPDVIVFEEFTSHWQSLLQKALWETYPHRIERPMEGAFGICMVSRLPLENARALPDDAGLSCMSGVITVAGEKVGILGVHPLPPTSPGYFSEWKASIGSWPSLLRQIPCTHRVLTGDLNSTPFSRAFANLC